MTSRWIEEKGGIDQNSGSMGEPAVQAGQPAPGQLYGVLYPIEGNDQGPCKGSDSQLALARAKTGTLTGHRLYQQLPTDKPGLVGE